jgi:hypothetical protein
MQVETRSRSVAATRFVFAYGSAQREAACYGGNLKDFSSVT